MRRQKVLAAAVLPLVLVAGSSVLGSQADDPDEPLPHGVRHVPDQYIVVLDDATPDVDQTASRIAARAFGRSGHTYRSALKGFVVKLPPGTDPRILFTDRRVLFVQRDAVLHALDHVASEVPTGVKRAAADQNPTNDLTGTAWCVAVIDTGIQLTHPDLNVIRNVTFVRWTTSGNDDNGHGTHVAGTIGARHNGTGVVGVAPGLPLCAVKVLNRTGSGKTSDIIKGIDWVTQNRSLVAAANMSLGGPATNADDGNCGNTNGDALHRAICNSVGAGVVYVVAAGNSSKDVKDFVPAGYREVVAVSALADSNGLPGGGGPATSYGADDTFASFSNFGDGVDLIAPGVNIRSTCLRSTYCAMSGTSMAAPHAAGAAALWIKKNGRPTTANANHVEFRNGILAQISESVPGIRGDPDGVPERMVNANTPETGGTGTSVCCPVYP